MRINWHRTGHNRCSRLSVHVTDNQPVNGHRPYEVKTRFRPLKNYDAMSGVLDAGGLETETVCDFQGIHLCLAADMLSVPEPCQ
jgi:hypothetical protein